MTHQSLIARFALLVALSAYAGWGSAIASPIQPDEEPEFPSAFVVIEKADGVDPKLLVRKLQQVLPKTQVVKQIKSPKPREIKLEVTNTRDLRALANKITFA
ncbi:MAG: hypothetical protein AAF085_11310, partial [Planctomycetota bacterium]